MNRTVLLTGASRGIGRAIALRFAHDGDRVLASDIPAQGDALEILRKDIEAAGGSCATMFCDVSRPEQVDALAAKAMALDTSVVVNNAGVLSVHRIEEIEPDEWDRMFAVNTKGTFLVTRALLGHLRARGSGRIVNIASIGGKRGAVGQAHYCASKAAVINFTQILALELGAGSITVNAVCPGIIDTDMGRNNYRNEDDLRRVHEKTALARLGQPEDVTGAVRFFAFEDAAFITGQTLNVCGGIIFH